jgi:hypothetical protein
MNTRDIGKTTNMSHTTQPGKEFYFHRNPDERLQTENRKEDDYGKTNCFFFTKFIETIMPSLFSNNASMKD